MRYLHKILGSSEARCSALAETSVPLEVFPVSSPNLSLHAMHLWLRPKLEPTGEFRWLYQLRYHSSWAPQSIHPQGKGQGLGFSISYNAHGGAGPTLPTPQPLVQLSRGRESVLPGRATAFRKAQLWLSDWELRLAQPKSNINTGWLIRRRN